MHSQHNCISNYIPYFAAFEITRKVAVGDGKVERPCQGAARGEFEGFYQTATCFKGIKCNYYAIINWQWTNMICLPEMSSAHMGICQVLPGVWAWERGYGKDAGNEL